MNRQPARTLSRSSATPVRALVGVAILAGAGALGVSIGGLVLFALALPVALGAGVVGLALWRRGHRPAALLTYAVALLAAAAAIAGFVDTID